MEVHSAKVTIDNEEIVQDFRCVSQVYVGAVFFHIFSMSHR